MKQAIIITSLILLSLGSQNIIDFSHSDQLQRSMTALSQKYDLNIQSDHKKNDYLAFPESCSLTDNLQSESSFVSDELLSIEQKKLESLKSNITELLQLSQLIKISKKRLTQSKTSSTQSESEELLTPDFSQLQQLQANLQNINSTISDMVKNLSHLIIQEMNKTKQGNFDSIRLTFERKIAQARLQYLQFLKTSRSRSVPYNVDDFITTLFQDVKQQISRERKQFDKVNELLNSYSDRQQLELRISNLQSQKDGLNMMIKEKEACQEKRMAIFSHQEKKVHQIISQLKRLKKLETQQSNFCEGVVPSLERQLKKILKVYNYSYACSEGLSDLKNSRILIEVELARLKNQEANIDYETKSEKLKKYFKDQQNWQNRLNDEIEHLRLSQHSMNDSTIEKQILLTKSRIKDLSYQIDHPPEASKVDVDYDKIKSMIVDIQKQQNEYCKLKDSYLSKYRVEDVNIRFFEHQSSILSEMKKSHLEKVAQLRQMQRRFHEMRGIILEQLQ